MFEIVETLLIQFVGLIPFLICFTLIMNLLCEILFGGK